MGAVNVAVMMIVVMIMIAVRAMDMGVLVHRVNSANQGKDLARIIPQIGSGSNSVFFSAKLIIFQHAYRDSLESGFHSPSIFQP